MKKTAILAFCLITVAHTFSQGLSNNGTQLRMVLDVASKPRLHEVRPEVDGSPYFSSEFCNATFVVDGKPFPNVQAMLNMEKNQVTFKNENNEEVLATSPISRIEFTNCGGAIFESGFPAIDHQNGNTYYRVLSKGNKAELLRYTQFNLRDIITTGLANSSYTKALDRADFYYISISGKGLVKIERNNESVKAALSDQSAKIGAFIDGHHLKVKKDSDLVAVVDYYNSL